MKIVRFEDGQFGVRKGWWLSPKFLHIHSLLRGWAENWSDLDNFLELDKVRGSLDQAERALARLKKKEAAQYDAGKAVKPSDLANPDFRYRNL